MPGEELLGYFLNFLGGIINTATTNRTNRKLQEQTNQTNVALSAQSNRAAKQEAELAYKRSLPTQHVRNMQMAGMSKAGAINAINGGGSYTPAPVNTAQVEAPQVAGLDASLFSNLASIMSAERMQKKQIKAQEEAQKAQIESNEKIAQMQINSSNRNADNRLQFDKEVFEAQKPKIRAEVNQIVQNTENLKKIGQGQELDNIRKKLENDNYPTLAKLANTQSWMVIKESAMKLAHEDANHMNKQERDTLELEMMRAVMDSGISLQNAQNELQSYLATQELSTYKSPTGGFIGALVFAMDKLIPKFASLK